MAKSVSALQVPSDNLIKAGKARHEQFNKQKNAFELHHQLKRSLGRRGHARPRTSYGMVLRSPSTPSFTKSSAFSRSLSASAVLLRQRPRRSYGIVRRSPSTSSLPKSSAFSRGPPAGAALPRQRPRRSSAEASVHMTWVSIASMSASTLASEPALLAAPDASSGGLGSNTGSKTSLDMTGVQHLFGQLAPGSLGSSASLAKLPSLMLSGSLCSLSSKSSRSSSSSLMVLPQKAERSGSDQVR
mmetsp:Transcript_6836/g.19325  ORF Transcript_6836/g.19325 Transcript_6836/m.19325 type:complete len:243 (-) Transcript_6836:3794-4522(-)